MQCCRFSLRNKPGTEERHAAPFSATIIAWRYLSLIYPSPADFFGLLIPNVCVRFQVDAVAFISTPFFCISLPIFPHWLDISLLIFTSTLSFPVNAQRHRPSDSRLHPKHEVTCTKPFLRMPFSLSAVSFGLSACFPAKSFSYRTYRIISRNSFGCRTYKNKGLISPLVATHPEIWRVSLKLLTRNLSAVPVFNPLLKMHPEMSMIRGRSSFRETIA
jgi:hypothetical protein